MTKRHHAGSSRTAARHTPRSTLSPHPTFQDPWRASLPPTRQPLRSAQCTPPSRRTPPHRAPSRLRT